MDIYMMQTIRGRWDKAKLTILYVEIGQFERFDGE